MSIFVDKTQESTDIVEEGTESSIEEEESTKSFKGDNTTFTQKLSKVKIVKPMSNKPKAIFFMSGTTGDLMPMLKVMDAVLAKGL